jgi:hypothetical protein
LRVQQVIGLVLNDADLMRASVSPGDVLAPS